MHAADRAARADTGDQWFLRAMADELLARLDLVTTQPREALTIGRCGVYLAKILTERGVKTTHCEARHATAGDNNFIQAEEDSLPFAPMQYDLVMSCGTLDSVNDLPGALIQIRRILKPGGLFLGAFLGAGSLSSLKAILKHAELEATGAASARIHPQIDVRSAGDLLSRAGYLLPVADQDDLIVRYDDLAGLVRDLRAMGWSNGLLSRQPFTRTTLAATLHAFSQAKSASGRFEEHMCAIYLTGWSPPDGKPKPSPRSLGEIPERQ